MKKPLATKILSYFGVFVSFVLIMFSFSLSSHASIENIAFTVSNVLSKKNDNVYNRVILEGISKVNNDDYISFEKNYLNRAYMKSHLFSTWATFVSINNVDYEINISEYDFKATKTTTYLWQDVKFYEGLSPSINEDIAIIPSSLALKISESYGYGDNVSELIAANKSFTLFNYNFVIGSVYDSKNTYNCTNSLYSSFGETILINSNKILELSTNFSELNHRFFFTGCPNYKININCFKACQSFFSKIVYPDSSINNSFYDNTSLRDYMSSFSNNNSSLFIILGITISVMGSIILLVCLYFLNHFNQENNMKIIYFCAMLIIPFLSFITYTKILPISFSIFSKQILFVSRLSVISFIVLYLLTILFVSINVRSVFKKRFSFPRNSDKYSYKVRRIKI